MSKKAVSILLVVIISLLLISYHFYEFLKVFSSNPSDMWSRDLTVGEKNLNMPSPLFWDGGSVYGIWTNDTGFAISQIYPFSKDTKKIFIKNFNETSVKNIEYYKGKIYWSENDNINEMETNGDNYENLNIIGVNFKIVDDYIITVNSQGIEIFNIENNFKKLSEVNLKNVSQIDAVHKNGTLYVSVLVDDKQEYKIYYLSYDIKGQRWSTPVEVYKLPQTATSKLDNIKIGYDKKVYIFYNLTSKTSSNVYYFYFDPQNSKGFEPRKLELNVYGKIPSPDVGAFDIKQFQDGIAGVFSALSSYNIIGQSRVEGTEIIYAFFKDGDIVKVKSVTKEGGWASEPYLLNAPKGLFLSWIEAGGFYKYIVKVASTNPEFIKQVGGIRKLDIQNALSLCTFSISAALLLGFIMTFSVSLPGYGWLLFVMLFEPRRFKNESINSFYIGMSLYGAAKYFFYPPQVIKNSMEQILFPYNLNIIPILTLILSFALVKMYFGGKKFNSNFAAFTFMVIIDSLFINLFYAPFLIK